MLYINVPVGLLDEIIFEIRKNNNKCFFSSEYTECTKNAILPMFAMKVPSGHTH